MTAKTELVICYVFAIWAGYVCATIEYYNWRAGGVLPRSEFVNEDPEQGLTKWRVSTILTEDVWRRYSGPRDPDGMPVHRPLTGDERRQMEMEFEQSRANSILRELVGSLGLLQYAVIPVVFVWSAWFLSVQACPLKLKMVALVPFGLSLAAGGLMFYRAYFASLGW